MRRDEEIEAAITKFAWYTFPTLRIDSTTGKLCGDPNVEKLRELSYRVADEARTAIELRICYGPGCSRCERNEEHGYFNDILDTLVTTERDRCIAVLEEMAKEADARLVGGASALREAIERIRKETP